MRLKVFYNPVMFLFLVLWVFCCFKSVEKIHANNWFYDEAMEKWLCLAAIVAGPLVLGGIYFCRFVYSVRNQLEQKMAEENEEVIRFKDYDSLDVFREGHNCGMQAEGVFIFMTLMKNFLESSAESVRFLPKPNGVFAVNFVFAKEHIPQFELNLMLGREIICGVKTAAGLDLESRKELQRGMISSSFRGVNTSLEVRSQGFFGGERMYIIKTAQKAEEDKK